MHGFTLPRMVAPRPGTEVTQVRRAPRMCTGCSKAACWDHGCQRDAAAAIERTPPPPPVEPPPAAPAAAAPVSPTSPPADPSPPRSPEVPETSDTAPKGKKPRTGAPLMVLRTLRDAGHALPRTAFDALPVDDRAVRNALHQAKLHGRVAVRANGDYLLTKEGRDYLAAKEAAGDATPAKAKSKPAPRKPRAKPQQPTAKKRAGKRLPKPSPMASASFAPQPGNQLAVASFEPVVERSFRSAIFNDGGLYLAKGGVVIELSAAEHAELQAQQRRMAAGACA